MTIHRHLQLTFGPETVTAPIIYTMVKQHQVIPNIRRANIEQHVGWMVLDLEGEASDLDAATEYLKGLGIEVSAAEGDIVAG
jgi:ABC-type methionine transport system ATPase subunit